MATENDKTFEETEILSDDPYAPKVLRVRGNVSEWDFLKDAVGDMSKFARKAIKNELEREGVAVPEGFFFERPPGNWTKGDKRRGKENRLTSVKLQPVFA